jgi:hypothetical protein
MVMRHDEDGRTLEVGARTQTIPRALRRAVPALERGYFAGGATETPRAPVFSIARATSPDALAASTTCRR